MRKAREKTERQAADASKRRDLKRLVAVAGLAFVAASFPLFVGCESTKKQKKENKTLDDFLSADKPSY